MSLPQPLNSSFIKRGRLARATGLIAAAAALSLPASATAAGPQAPTFALRAVTNGPYYVFDARPGATVVEHIRVINTGTASGSVRLYAVDATTGPTSGATYLTQPGRGRGVGAWTRISVPAVTLRPRQSRLVAFTVHVPRGTRPGDHLGGITADPGVQHGRTVRRSKSSFRIDVRALTVIAVEARVPGPRSRELTVTGVRAGGLRSYQQLFLRLGNPGNTLLKGSGSVSVSSSDGHPLKSSSFALDTFVPGTQIDFPVFVRGKALPEGRYKATVTLHFAGRTITRTFWFKIGARELQQVFGPGAPSSSGTSGIDVIWLVAGGLLLLLLGFGGAAIMFKRREARLAAQLRERELHELEMWSLRTGSDPDAALPTEDHGASNPHEGVDG